MYIIGIFLILCTSLVVKISAVSTTSLAAGGVVSCTIQAVVLSPIAIAKVRDLLLHSADAAFWSFPAGLGKPLRLRV